MNKVLIIGASRGIGLEFARQLCASGSSVVATARDPKGLDQLEALGAKALQLDVAKPKSIEHFLSALSTERFDWVLHVAGVFGPRSDAMSALSLAQFDEVMHTNVGSVIQMLPALTPRLTPARGKWVSVSSVMASISLTQDSSGWAYKISKAALNMAVHSASKQHKNLILVAMSPGWVQTDMGTLAAPLTAKASVSNMLKTIESLEHKDTGKFLNHDGLELGW